MQVIKPGSKVRTKMGNVSAIVTGVCMRDGSVMYEIAWFVGGKRECIWVYNFEVESDTQQKGEVGLFNTNKGLELAG